MGRVLVLLLLGATCCASPVAVVSAPEATTASASADAVTSTSRTHATTPKAEASTPQSAASDTAAASTPGAAPTTVPSTPGAALTTAPWPGVACDDATAAPNLRFFACTSACDRGEAVGCETLGDLHAVEEGESTPSSSAGPAARAWRKACALGANAACAKETQLLTRLDADCRAHVAACVVQGNALHELDADAYRSQADALFQRACRKGHALGCYHSAELHAEWEPQAEHAALSRAGYLRACQLGAAEGCCSALSVYEAGGNLKAAARVRHEMSKIMGAGCGSGGPVVPLGPAPFLELTTQPLHGASLSSQALETNRAVCHRVLRYCYSSSSSTHPDATWQHAVDVEIDAQGRVSAVVPVPERDPSQTSSGPPPAMSECLNARLRTLQFEATAAAYVLRVTASAKAR